MNVTKSHVISIKKHCRLKHGIGADECLIRQKMKHSIR